MPPVQAGRLKKMGSQAFLFLFLEPRPPWTLLCSLTTLQGEEMGDGGEAGGKGDLQPPCPQQPAS